MITTRRELLAYTLPFVLFMAGLAAVSAAKALGIDTFCGVALDPMYWIYPGQSILCAGALIWFRRSYDFSKTTAGNLLVGAVVGLVVLGLWVAPQELFHQPKRVDGFNPRVV